jgi:ABC-2 type transport system ATP-binding protein
MKKPRIRTENLSKRYKGADTFSLEKVNLSIPSGDIYGILGPNGAGKTTLISILCGIFEPTEGSLSYCKNSKTVSFDQFQSNIGYVPQEYAFFEELSPLQNLEYFGAMYNLNKKAIKEKSSSILDLLGLQKVAHDRILTFSGGMKRRVNLAIGIIHNPSVLFLDEPTVGVDVQSKLAILRILKELNQQGTTIIYTSHHLSEAEAFCNSISLLDHGKVIVEGSLKALMKEHETQNLKDLFLRFTGEELRD